MQPALRIEAASPEDAAAIHALVEVCGLGWSRRAVEAELGSTSVVLLARAGAPIGFLAGTIVAGEAELRLIGVHPEARRRGVGAALIARWLAGQGVEEVFLEVRADDAGAQAFYAALGFEPGGTRPAYYADGGAALLMRLGTDRLSALVRGRR